jgi:hypothetical protein
MSRLGAGLLLALLVALSIPSLVHNVCADEPAPAVTTGAGRSEPNCLSTVTVLSDGQNGSELRFAFGWSPDLSEGVPAGHTVAGEPVRASYRRADDAGAPLGQRASLADGPASFPEGRTWQAESVGPASYSVLLRVPDRGAIEMDVISCELVSSDGTPLPGPERVDALGSVKLSAPAIMRDLRLVSVTFDPVLGPPFDAVVRSVSVSVRASGAAGANEKLGRKLPPSPAFDRLYASEVLNHIIEPASGVAVGGPAWDGSAGRGDDDRWKNARGRVDGAPYLIVTSDSMTVALEPLIEWKERKGIPVEVATLETIGFTFEAIRDYVQNAYDTWDTPPEYLLLVGDTEVLPALADTFASDNHYVTTEGDDILPDILVGRFSVDFISQCENMVAKTVFYERTPYEDDPNWPASASLCQRDDGDDGDWIYYENTWYLYDLFTDAGFAVVDTFFTVQGITYNEVWPAWNAGRGFMHYRGQALFWWIMPFDAPIHHEYGIRNGLRAPIIVSPTCGTGVYDDDGYMCEDWTTGLTGVEPHGAVAFFGTSTAFEGSQKLSLMRSAVSFGFFGNGFGENGLTLGEACVAGKLNLHATFEDTSEFEGWNLLGDPELNMWTAPPAHATVLHDPALQIGPTDLTVTVLEGGLAVSGALVSCVKEGEVYTSGYTGELGSVTLPVAPATAGTLDVIVTARNCYPYEGDVLVLESGPFVAFADRAIEDGSGGNGDGLLSPGESVALEVGLMNVGDVLAESVSAVFRTADSYVTVTDSTCSFADIQPDSVEWALDDVAFSVDASCPPGHVVSYSLEVNYSGESGTRYPEPIEVVTGRLVYAGAVFDDAPPGGDGDGVPEAGETVALEVTLLNEGECDLGEIAGVVSADDPFAAVTQGAAPFDDASTGGTCTNSADALLLSVSPAAPDAHLVSMTLALAAEGDSYSWSDTLVFDIALTNPTYMGPTGPDEYGYYAYDSLDTIYAAAPVYDWVDIAPPGPGMLITEITDEDAGIVTLSTMFNVKYYGEIYTNVSVNSNGFIAVGASDYRFGDNSPIPDTHGPPAMIAAFWDDLDPSAGGEIYRWFDFAGKRWVYQFDEVLRYGTGQAETFQVIIYNEDYHPTPTGDAPILIQYETVTFPYACTVGIEDHFQTDGIEWVCNGDYAPQALPLESGMAILFTTEPPGEPDVPWLVLDAVTVDDSAGGNGDGVVQPGETVSLVLGVRNDGGRDALGPSVVLSSGEGTVSVVDGTAVLTDVLAGGSGSTVDALVCEFSDAIDDTVATLWAAFEANGGAYTTTARCDVHIDLSGTGVEDGVVPSVFSLSPCHPNPFTSGATMRLALPAPERVTVRIYDPAGRLVRMLVDEAMPAGEHSLAWDGRDGSGRHVASGVYFVRAEAGRRSDVRKIVRVR